MPSFNEDKTRFIIPRWRNFNTTLRSLELSSLFQPNKIKTISDTAFVNLLQDWKKNRSFSYAADLISSSIVLGRESEVKDAAEFILLDKSSSFYTIKEIARNILNSNEEIISDFDIGNDYILQIAARKIHDIRVRLRDEPRNALLWVELSRVYAINGFHKQAKHSMDVAYRLVPENRFVLRSAARLYLHLHKENNDDFDIAAHDILRKSERVKIDPWVLAAEIAIASKIERTPNFVKQAKDMTYSKDFNPFHLSELSSALGSLEIESETGKVKKAREYLKFSLDAPSENAVAQASWIARTYFNIPLENKLASAREKSYEAKAWFDYFSGNWEKAEKNARQWLIDQPFSCRPAILDSYILGEILENYEESKNVASIGLHANPSDFVLLNNYAFAAACSGQIDDAQNIFSLINKLNLSDKECVVWHATKGLLSYRSGDPIQGRNYYLNAIAEAERLREKGLEALAAIHFAFEELRINASEAEQYRRRALDYSSNPHYPAISLLQDRLSKFKYKI